MDQSTKDFTINAELLGALGALWLGKPTTVSPFRYGDGKAPGKEEKARLAAAGVCDASGKPDPGIRPALDILGNAQAFTRMYITGGLNAYEYIVYFTEDGKSASLINIHGDVQINYPSIADLFVEMASQAIGSTVYRNTILEASLTPIEALVLAAMVDLQRQEFLQAIAGSRKSVIVAYSPSDIGTILSRREEDFQWLNNVIRDMNDLADLPSRDQIVAALESITKKAFMKKEGTAYKLSDEGQLFARRMLVFDSSVVLTFGYLGQDKIIHIAGFTCLQAGVHDLLIIEANDGTINLQSISSAAVLDSIRTFMTDPSVMKRLDTSPSAGQQPATDIHKKKFCPKCGIQISEGKQFCSNCGARII